MKEMMLKEDLLSLIEDSMAKLRECTASGALIGPIYDENVVFLGDTHTAVDVSRKAFEKYSDMDRIVFLGDYVDRGDSGVENMAFILSKFLDMDGRVILIRGNHESPLTHQYYGFLDEVLGNYDEETYMSFVILFSNMPYGAVVNDYLCVHGGLAHDVKTIEDIRELPLGDVNPDDPRAFEIMWNDPRDMIEGFVPNARGEGTYYFGADIVDEFLRENGLKGIIRAHEVADGFRYDMDGKVITVFSSRYHKMRAGALVMRDGMFSEEWL